MRFSVPWHVGFGINSEVFDMETNFEIICSARSQKWLNSRCSDFKNDQMLVIFLDELF